MLSVQLIPKHETIKRQVYPAPSVYRVAIARSTATRAVNTEPLTITIIEVGVAYRENSDMGAHRATVMEPDMKRENKMNNSLSCTIRG